MLCERCKIREANIVYTEVIGGVRTEHHYCAQCAKELDFGPYSAIFDTDFPLGRFLSGLLGIAEAGSEEEKGTPQIVCPTCGTTYQEFIDNSLFGCQDCYGVFDLLIADHIRQLQGNVSHTGKKPAGYAKLRPLSAEVQGGQGEVRLSDAEEIELAEARLKDALQREDYEAAAACRDEIRRLREGGNER